MYFSIIHVRVVKVSSCVLPAHPLLLCSESLAAFVSITISIFLEVLLWLFSLGRGDVFPVSLVTSIRDQHEGMLILPSSFDSVTVF